MCNKPIGIFDSGLGGLTVLREIHMMIPGENLVYFGDSKRAPYGTKSRDAIIKFAFQDMRFMLSKDVKAIVIACNTVSSNALEKIINEFDIPVLEVISPGSAAGLTASETKTIGVIGTSATIESNAYENELKKLDKNCRVLQKSCPLFVPLVEEGVELWDSEIAELTALHYLYEFRNSGIDTLILGCTHYPLLKNVIQKAMGDEIKLIDSAKSIAKMLKNSTIIKDNHSGTDGSIKIFTSDSISKFMPLCKEILGKDNLSVEQVDIENY